MATQAKNPIAAAVGAAFLASVTLAPLGQAGENPFQAHNLGNGYNLADKAMTEGKCGEGKCGESMRKANEGNCAGDKAATAGEGKCGGSKKPETKPDDKAAGSDTKAGSGTKP